MNGRENSTEKKKLVDRREEERFFNPSSLTQVTHNITDFDVVQTLGTGSFGRVLLVKDKKDHGRFTALKVLKKAKVVKLKQVSGERKRILNMCGKLKQRCENTATRLQIFVERRLQVNRENCLQLQKKRK